MKLSASFLSIRENIKENIEKLCETNIDYLHLDIMDGQFVENKSWNIDEIKALIKDINKPLDIHLMVSDIKKYIDDFKELDPEYITFHVEAGNTKGIIELLKNYDIKIGLSLKPSTDINELIPYLRMIDLVLVMSVDPGMGGQIFMESAISKVETLNKLRQENNYSYVIEVDGGINDETINLVDADIYVVGSYITNGDYQEQVDKLLNKF